MKRLLLILALICMIIFPVFSQTGSLTTNEYFYLPEYGAYGTAEYDEYNTYMEVADNQIEANKTGIVAIDLSLYYLKTEIDALAEWETIWSKDVLDTTELNTFAKLQALVADKTLVNEEDVFTIDANWINTANPWADNEVANNITIDLATLATTLTITDNESTNENNAILFTSGGDLDGGNLGIESDGNLYYNPSTGTIGATEFVGGGTGLTGLQTTLTNEAGLYSALSDVSLFLEELKCDTSPELGGTLDHNNERDTEVKTIEFNGLYANGSSGATPTIDWQNGNYQSITTDENMLFTFSNAFIGTITIVITYGGSHTVGFNVGYTIHEEGGTELSFTETGSAVDILKVMYLGSANNYVVGVMLDVKD